MKEPDPRQRRFIEPDPETFNRRVESLGRALEGDPHAWVGIAPHSVRAVPVEYLRRLKTYAYFRHLSVHMHVAEQPAEVEACVAETGRTPVALLADEGLLSPRFTAVHAVHVTPEEVGMLSKAHACVCACPTTERNLGDGVVPADSFFDAGVRVSLGTDSHTQIDLLEDARELEYHLRLKTLRRNVLAPDAPEIAGLAARLFHCATVAGAESIGALAGEFEPGRAADFFTVDLEDPTVAGASVEDLLPAILFSLARAGIKETAGGGRLITEAGRHPSQDVIVSRFKALQKRLWS
jgi:formimidoylglutamate deiminase